MAASPMAASRWDPPEISAVDTHPRHSPSPAAPVIRLSAIQMLSDADPCGDATIVVVAGRSLIFPCPAHGGLLLSSLIWRLPGWFNEGGARFARAPSTLRAYASDWRAFSGWAAEQGAAAMPGMEQFP